MIGRIIPDLNFFANKMFFWNTSPKRFTAFVALSVYNICVIQSIIPSSDAATMMSARSVAIFHIDKYALCGYPIFIFRCLDII